MKFEFALWTRDMVRELIREQFNVWLSEVSVGRLLRELGLPPERPLARAYQRDPELLGSWVREAYPAIVRQANAVGHTYFSSTNRRCARIITAARRGRRTAKRR